MKIKVAKIEQSMMRMRGTSQEPHTFRSMSDPCSLRELQRAFTGVRELKLGFRHI